MTNPDELFAGKFAKEKVKGSKNKIPEVTINEDDTSSDDREGEWYLEDPDKKKDRVAFVRIHKDHDFTTKAS